MSEMRRTPFYDLQAAAGARFVEFAGWELPVQFTGVVAEHQAVRTNAGLFDVSHMGELIIEGPGALDAVQYAVTNDVAKLVDGKALYTAMCVADGGIVDDLIVYRESEQRYFLVVNGARVAADVEHLQQVTGRFACSLGNVSDAWGQLALQGPAALGILGGLTNVDAALMKPFTFVDAEVGGVAGVRVARTGYTGEEGVELYMRAADGPALWRALVEQGSAGPGIALCGLGARDTLRLEMKYALYGNDIDLDHNPIEAGLGWVVKMKKGDFLGRDALVAVKARGPSRQLVGFKMRGRGIPRHGYPLHDRGGAIGVVTSGTHSPSLGEPIGVGYVRSDHADLGSTFDVIIRGKAVPAEVVATPFYTRN